MVPNLSTAARTYSATSSSSRDVGGDRERLGGGRQVLDGGLEILLLAVDGDDARAAFGQKPDGGGSDDAGCPGDDGDPAVQANSIGHIWGFLWLLRLSRILVVFARGHANGSDYFICGEG